MAEIIVTTKTDLEEIIQNSVRQVLSEQVKGKEEIKNEIFSLTQTATFLNLSPQTLYGFTSKRKIPFIKKGKKLYFRRPDLEKWLETGRKQSREEIANDLEKNKRR